MPPLDAKRAAALVGRFDEVSALVVGDLMIDRFIWGRVTRISPEAPVPVVRLERESRALGGAANVARNIVMLGGRAIPVGVRGDDREGEELESACREAGIPTEGLITTPGRPTTVKMRVIAHSQHVVRVDREQDDPLPFASAADLEKSATGLLERVQVIVISDYAKGCISERLLRAVLPEAERRRLPIVIDPKVSLFPHYRPATIVTPNTRELAEAVGMPVRTEEELIAAGRKLLEMLACPHLLITCGERGMLLLDDEGGALAIPTTAREVFDVTGAGDTVVATLALALAAGAHVTEASMLANQAAGVVVGKIGTAAPTPEELLECTAGVVDRSA